MIDQPRPRPLARLPGWLGSSDFRLLGLGMVAWTLAMAAFWPEGLSFSDEVGYVGEAKLLLAGRLTPSLHDVGVWVQTSHGLVPQYPLLLSSLLLPFLAVTPRAIFAVGLLFGLALCYAAARVLKRWGANPVWALVMLMHPTVVILSRTATSDVALGTLGLLAWMVLRDNRRALAIASFAALFAIKATGMLVGACLVAGEIVGMVSLPSRAAAGRRSRLITCGLAIAAGFLCIFLTNEVSAGQPWFAYDLAYLGTPPFWFSYLGRSGPAHLRTVLLFPPLLAAGALPYWRRSAWGPLFVIFGYGTLMCFYFFVDSGRTLVESLVLSPRLLMPVVAFLLVGYAQVAAELVSHAPRLRPIVPLSLMIGAVATALGVGRQHARWQAPMAAARRATEAAARRTGANEIGVAPQATKVGLLLSGPLWVGPVSQSADAVVLCSDHSASYRAPHDGGDYNCAVAGYRLDSQVDGFQILVRRSAEERSAVAEPRGGRPPTAP